MEDIKKYLNENVIGVLIVIGMMIVYHLLSIETNVIPGFFKYIPRNLIAFVFIISPGVLSAGIYAIFTKNVTKILIVGISAIIIWVYWFSAIYPAIIYDYS